MDSSTMPQTGYVLLMMVQLALLIGIAALNLLAWMGTRLAGSHQVPVYRSLLPVLVKNLLAAVLILPICLDDALRGGVWNYTLLWGDIWWGSHLVLQLLNGGIIFYALWERLIFYKYPLIHMKPLIQRWQSCLKLLTWIVVVMVTVIIYITAANDIIQYKQTDKTWHCFLSYTSGGSIVVFLFFYLLPLGVCWSLYLYLVSTVKNSLFVRVRPATAFDIMAAALTLERPVSPLAYISDNESDEDDVTLPQMPGEPNEHSARESIMSERDLLDVSRWLMQNNLSDESRLKQNTAETIEQLMNSLPPAKQANRLPTLNTPMHGKISPRNLFNHDDKYLNNGKLRKDGQQPQKNMKDNDMTIINERQKNPQVQSLDSMTGLINNLATRKSSKDIKEINIEPLNIANTAIPPKEVKTEETLTPRRISIAWIQSSHGNQTTQRRIKWPSIKEVNAMETDNRRQNSLSLENGKCNVVNESGKRNSVDREVTGLTQCVETPRERPIFIPVEEERKEDKGFSESADAVDEMESDVIHGLPATRNSRRLSCDITHSDYMALRRLIYVLASHTLCWTPFYVIYLLSATTDYLKDPHLILSWLLTLGYVHSMVNPFIYFMKDAAFKREIKDLLKKICSRENKMTGDENDQDTGKSTGHR